jgi:hypothetical protein
VLGKPVVEIERYFNISRPAVSMYLEGGEIIAKKRGLNNFFK